MDIKDFLAPAAVFVDIRASKKAELLKDLCHRAASSLQVDADEITAHIFKREELGSTGTGDGIAIPHARIQGVMKPFGMLVKLSTPIDLDAIDGQPVDLIFMLLLPPAAEHGQLDALASVARKLRVAQTVLRMRQAGTATELYFAISE
jgi:PTS system nitrogen regulatory IIA component